MVRQSLAQFAARSVALAVLRRVERDSAYADVAFSPMWVTTTGFKARTVVASATG